MKSAVLLLAASLLAVGVQAQRTCGSPAPDARWQTWFNDKVLETKKDQGSRNLAKNFTIPVVVHVVHGGEQIDSYPNISQAQINSQINVLNDDFAGAGLNVGNLAATGFSAIGAADCSISFCLAKYDPSGNVLPEPGIDRINYLSKSWANPANATSVQAFQNYMNNTVKPNSIWDPNRYFNIWVSDHAQSVDLLGYATFPVGTGLSGVPGTGGATDDGIWVWAKSFGNTGTLVPPFHKGRTATHEVGHWLGLIHIGGDGGGNINGSCSATDYCNDTPPQKGGFANGEFGQNYGTPSYPLHVGVCSSPFGDMFMNFMDYSDDPTLYMFTPDQSTRMTTAMNNGTFRKQLTASSATLCTVTGISGEKGDEFLHNLMLYPNPSNGLFVIHSDGEDLRTFNFEIQNCLGQKLGIDVKNQISVNTAAFDLSNCGNGIYFIVIRNGHDKAVKRLIVNR